MNTKERQKVTITAEAGVAVAHVFKTKVPAGVLVLENPRTIMHLHSYGGISRFFEGLAMGALLGTKCVRCNGEIWLPPRVHCPDCWEEMLWQTVDTREARVYSFSVTNYPGAGFKGTVPCPLISLAIPKVCTNMMSYLSEFGDDEPYIGMRVKPIFRREKPTRTILDLSWVPR